mmetsp:Transcript_24221/g.74972  ORF Transcript_24221/g.74972 Transcript_24221/m.74972 type:complete len:1153 (-) Transcript_24221:109-3567(-)
MFPDLDGPRGASRRGSLTSPCTRRSRAVLLTKNDQQPTSLLSLRVSAKTLESRGCQSTAHSCTAQLRVMVTRCATAEGGGASAWVGGGRQKRNARGCGSLRTPAKSRRSKTDRSSLPNRCFLHMCPTARVSSLLIEHLAVRVVHLDGGAQPQVQRLGVENRRRAVHGHDEVRRHPVRRPCCELARLRRRDGAPDEGRGERHDGDPREREGDARGDTQRPLHEGDDARERADAERDRERREDDGHARKARPDLTQFEDAQGRVRNPEQRRARHRGDEGAEAKKAVAVTAVVIVLGVGCTIRRGRDDGRRRRRRRRGGGCCGKRPRWRERVRRRGRRRGGWRGRRIVCGAAPTPGDGADADDEGVVELQRERAREEQQERRERAPRDGDEAEAPRRDLGAETVHHEKAVRGAARGAQQHRRGARDPRHGFERRHHAVEVHEHRGEGDADEAEDAQHHRLDRRLAEEDVQHRVQQDKEGPERRELHRRRDADRRADPCERREHTQGSERDDEQPCDDGGVVRGREHERAGDGAREHEALRQLLLEVLLAVELLVMLRPLPVAAPAHARLRDPAVARLRRHVGDAAAVVAQLVGEQQRERVAADELDARPGERDAVRVERRVVERRHVAELAVGQLAVVVLQALAAAQQCPLPLLARVLGRRATFDVGTEVVLVGVHGGRADADDDGVVVVVAAVNVGGGPIGPRREAAGVPWGHVRDTRACGLRAAALLRLRARRRRCAPRSGDVLLLERRRHEVFSGVAFVLAVVAADDGVRRPPTGRPRDPVAEVRGGRRGGLLRGGGGVGLREGAVGRDPVHAHVLGVVDLQIAAAAEDAHLVFEAVGQVGDEDVVRDPPVPHDARARDGGVEGGAHEAALQLRHRIDEADEDESQDVVRQALDRLARLVRRRKVGCRLHRHEALAVVGVARRAVVGRTVRGPGPPNTRPRCARGQVVLVTGPRLAGAGPGVLRIVAHLLVFQVFIVGRHCVLLQLPLAHVVACCRRRHRRRGRPRATGAHAPVGVDVAEGVVKRWRRRSRSCCGTAPRQRDRRRRRCRDDKAGVVRGRQRRHVNLHPERALLRRRGRRDRGMVACARGVRVLASSQRVGVALLESRLQEVSRDARRLVRTQRRDDVGRVDVVRARGAGGGGSDQRRRLREG